MIDSETGIGAYQISGGASGGIVVLLFIGALLSVLGIFLVSSATLPFLAGLSLGVGAVSFLGSTLALLLSGELSLTMMSVFRAITASIALILVGTEAAATVALTSLLGFIASMISMLLLGG